MRVLEIFAEKWNLFCQKIKPVTDWLKRFFKAADKVICLIWKYIVQFRKVFAAIPVALGAIYLAMYNMDHLPDTVGWGLQADGIFDQLVSKVFAVWGPIAVTALCLLLMFCSKRILTPWLVSLFSLALPVLILVTNIFSA